MTETMMTQRVKELLEACILSDQVPVDQVIELMKDREFARWYLRRSEVNRFSLNAK